MATVVTVGMLPLVGAGVAAATPADATQAAERSSVQASSAVPADWHFYGGYPNINDCIDDGKWFYKWLGYPYDCRPDVEGH
ncbi:hypothetical protein QQY66_48560 [Streptomyces sp. DG2A-72]|uniref:hypothetical protein n=1 Tax=Streptomyces sp. DG2A-72 TaxID=3051386 RepID=UPI00265B80DA|nr:hypothetical protein [Streptomyces sp. DG2A-72]MDO0939175.1 hypothetical protein [Streptomyces sp. DG2A-72]